jgi:hypothetical protein
VNPIASIDPKLALLISRQAAGTIIFPENSEEDVAVAKSQAISQ